MHLFLFTKAYISYYNHIVSSYGNGKKTELICVERGGRQSI